MKEILIFSGCVMFIGIVMTVSAVMSQVTYQRFKFDVWWVKYPIIMFVTITSLFMALIFSVLIWTLFLPSKKIGDSFWEDAALFFFTYIVFRFSRLVTEAIEKSLMERKKKAEIKTRGDCTEGLLRT